MTKLITRRRLVIGSGALVTGVTGGLIASNWAKLSTNSTYWPLLRQGEKFSQLAQRFALFERPLAPELRRDQISRHFPSTGGIGASFVDPNPRYAHLLATHFRDWRLSVEGLVDRRLSLSLDEIRQMPSRSQITMHSCDQGWTAIAEWTGTPLRGVLEAAGLRSTARYAVFYSLDTVAGEAQYDSLDLLDAFHPQTILAHSMNGQPLQPSHGAPLRLRMELGIGYKQRKHLDRIVLVNSLKDFGNGFGASVVDLGYQWYGGL